MDRTIYLDHCSTTPVAESVAEAMLAAQRGPHANPASQHGPGRAARRAIEDARERIASLLGAETQGMEADQLIFTSGGTEANTLALRGLCGAPGSRLLISSIEHPSISATADQMRLEGYRVETIRVGPTGVIDLDHANSLLLEEPRPTLVSVMLGNNETGVSQPVRLLAARCAELGVAMHTDAVQAVGKIGVGFRDLGVAALSMTPHKFHGPLGVGVLLLRHGVQIKPSLYGGHQQGGLRPGTESVALAAGTLAALQQWEEPPTERLAALRDRLEQGVLKIEPRAEVLGAVDQRLPHVSCLAIRGLDRQALAMALDLAGVACSTGSACASGSSEPSPVLLAMGLDRELVDSAIRLSVGPAKTPKRSTLPSSESAWCATDFQPAEKPFFGLAAGPVGTPNRVESGAAARPPESPSRRA